MKYPPREEHVVMGRGLDGLRRRLMCFAVLCLWSGLLAGLIGSLLYTPLQPLVKVWGMSLRSLRPLHLTAGTGWIYLGGLAMVVHYWGSGGRGGGGWKWARRALWFFLATWGVGAIVVAVTLAAGSYAGREYFFVSVPASVLFWVGWLPVAWVFLRSGGGAESGGLGGQPVYRWMWMSSFGLFTYAFVETHAFLLPYFQGHPLRDMAVEWKSYGTLVGSFNLLVYGSLAYLGQRLNPGNNYGRSRMAFALFWVGVLNSFTNYGHHTYHVPQTHVLKWVSFIVSMTEIVILAKVAWDVWGLARRYQRERGRAWDLVTWLLGATTAWTCIGLVLSIAISVPPLNSFIHGTYVVAGHAMGSMLGVDTMGLLAALTWVYAKDREAAGGGPVNLPRWPAAVLNLGVLLLWGSFLALGMNDSINRWESGLLPSFSVWPVWFGYAFVCGGLMIATGAVALTWRWLIPRWLLDEPGREIESGAELAPQGAGEGKELAFAAQE